MCCYLQQNLTKISPDLFSHTILGIMIPILLKVIACTRFSSISVKSSTGSGEYANISVCIHTYCWQRNRMKRIRIIRQMIIWDYVWNSYGRYGTHVHQMNLKQMEFIWSACSTIENHMAIMWVWYDTHDQHETHMIPNAACLFICHDSYLYNTRAYLYCTLRHPPPKC